MEDRNLHYKFELVINVSLVTSSGDEITMFQLKNIRTCLLLAILILPGCVSSRLENVHSYPTPMRPINDGGFLSEEPCGAPCFFGITLNKTSEVEAIQILSTFYNLDICNYMHKSTEGGIRLITCPAATTVIDKYVYINLNATNIVDEIHFTPEGEITINDVIDVHGDPSWVSVVTETDEGTTPMIIYMLVTYESLDTELILPSQEAETYSLVPTTPIQQIIYNNVSNTMFAQSWNGFGEYTVNIP